MFGAGILKGMRVTASNFFRSFYVKENLTTIPYPEEQRLTPDRSRTIPFLVYDGEDQEAGLRCTACCICEKACPPQIIYIVPSRDEKNRIPDRLTCFLVDPRDGTDWTFSQSAAERMFPLNGGATGGRKGDAGDARGTQASSPVKPLFL